MPGMPIRSHYLLTACRSKSVHATSRNGRHSEPGYKL